ncbi:serum response factor homolog B-like [Rosa chinensis]|uniref:serum response factor homolog B-like n=1 Tax=Rosa chinensis TaxID=74649 RepID=UPI001AD92D63|nr:serum response factor homolog B-like [Rosa chinensis]
MILILKRLPSEFSTVRMMIKAKHAPISMFELRSLLLASESGLENESKSLVMPSMTAMVAKNASCSFESQDTKGVLPTPNYHSYNGLTTFHNGHNGSRNNGGNYGGFRNNNGGNNGGCRNNNGGNYGGFKNNNGGNNSSGWNNAYKGNNGTRNFGNKLTNGFQRLSYGGFRPTIMCQICDKPGHSAQICWHLSKVQGNVESLSFIE